MQKNSDKIELKELNNEQYKKLIYRSWHRGCKETDILLGNFAKSELAKFSLLEVKEYEQFLEEEDSTIYKWLTEQEKCLAQYEELVNKIKMFFQSK